MVTKKIVYPLISSLLFTFTSYSYGTNHETVDTTIENNHDLNNDKYRYLKSDRFWQFSFLTDEEEELVKVKNEAHNKEVEKIMRYIYENDRNFWASVMADQDDNPHHDNPFVIKAKSYLQEYLKINRIKFNRIKYSLKEIEDELSIASPGTPLKFLVLGIIDSGAFEMVFANKVYALELELGLEIANAKLVNNEENIPIPIARAG